MSKKIKNKIIESDDSMIEQSDTESKTSSKSIQKSKKRPVECNLFYNFLLFLYNIYNFKYKIKMILIIQVNRLLKVEIKQ
jgi:hypothetical protein